MNAEHSKAASSLMGSPIPFEELSDRLVISSSRQTGKSALSRAIQDMIIQKLISGREHVNYGVADLGRASMSLVIRIKLSNWFVKNYPTMKIAGVVKLYASAIRKKPPARKTIILDEKDVVDLFDVNKHFTLWHYAELTRALNITNLD